MRNPFPRRNSRSVQQATLCFLVRGDEVLLAMKKRGFGEGLWNGTGGKFDPDKDSNLIDTAKRETVEEIRIAPLYLKRKAVLHFYFPEELIVKGGNQDVHVFVSKKWKGRPKESDEMKPKWFEIGKLPFESMWDGDDLWIPRVLRGDMLECWFRFDENNKVIKHILKTLQIQSK